TAMQGSHDFYGKLDLSSIAVGPVTLTVTASDANGESTTSTRNLIHDRPFAFKVDTRPESVARPDLRLHATCFAGAYACAAIEVSAGGTVLATTNTPSSKGDIVLDKTVSLAAIEPKNGVVEPILRFTARNAVGTVVTRDVPIHVESS